ncbi:TonB family C-terminal domain-containing protein [Pedobacter antarcticus]|nr:M56 family metallopeptidase [Pedobacter antarcticus]SFE77080.1 TonB family C-terminal domain-containing protein [Pedobacter antarcticus]
MNWIIYILVVNSSLLLFYLLYKLLLEKETFFRLNRYYLITAAMSAMLIPLIPQDWLPLQKDLLNENNPREILIMLSEVSVSPLKSNTPVWISFALSIYLAGGIFFTLKLFRRLIQLRKIISEPLSGVAFSFFSFKCVDRRLVGAAIIDRHEEVHIRHLHSADIIFFEILAIMCWFNPVIYAYKKSIVQVHEFYADEIASAYQGDKSAYAMLLLSKALRINPQVLTNSFFNEPLLKTRIHMLNKRKSAKPAALKYALFVPLCAGTLLLTSATLTKETKSENSGTGNSYFASTPLNQFGLQQQEPGKVYEFVKTDTQPEFPGGMKKFYEYLGASLKYPESAAKNKVEGKVFLSYIVETDGKISHVKVERGLNAALDAEAVRVLTESPNWIPGKVGNTPVRVKYNIPIHFGLTKKPAKA